MNTGTKRQLAGKAMNTSNECAVTLVELDTPMSDARRARLHNTLMATYAEACAKLREDQQPERRTDG